jgi:hypothetical protein
MTFLPMSSARSTLEAHLDGAYMALHRAWAIANEHGWMGWEADITQLMLELARLQGDCLSRRSPDRRWHGDDPA